MIAAAAQREGWKLASWGKAHVAVCVHARKAAGSCLVTTLCGTTAAAWQTGAAFDDLGPTRCQRCLRLSRSAAAPAHAEPQAVAL